MARSIRKGPYIDHNLDRKVMVLNDANKKISCENMVKAFHDIS